ncbi:GNAT family N-acetyltransferase [Aurantibacillus circumpalustris]|uniref:GNAT family N-acetyltransferase n=1 Tax=Aurantibacillus circumpalustris TaxID=3036359 RepID=UPI00295A5D12|nr:GNAT family N-acetyltransferase [Aurantibacillus circumpalustris]
MQKIIDPVSKEALLDELSRERYVRKANNGSNEIYIVTHNDSPNVMREIGRLREVTFRHAGGGTGKEIDIDEFDVGKHAYKQLLVWSPEDKEIVGAYRFILCKDAEFIDGKANLATTELFNFSDEFYKNYLNETIELGRSFIQPVYQPGENRRKGLFSLDNLWDGLGALVIDNPSQKHFYGKVTMYTDFNVVARDYILSFLDYYFPDKDKLVVPVNSIERNTNTDDFVKLLHGQNYKEGHAILHKHVRDLGENIPPLMNAYMNLSPTMKSFGTAINTTFGDVEETGILVTIKDVYDSKKERHFNSYLIEKGLRTLDGN